MPEQATAGDLLAPRLQQELAAALARERDRLGRIIRSLAATERALRESQGAESDPGEAPADVASDLAEAEITLNLQREERKRLAEVEAALHRMAGGTYGMCERCRRPIDPHRLYARPWARLCRPCVE
jgi:RNA polymerase-binding transcription factor DksA